jgi:hypothetical protein
LVPAEIPENCSARCPTQPAAIRRRGDVLPSIECRRRAFSRTGDPTLGEFEDAVILKTFGDVPVDFGTPESA